MKLHTERNTDRRLDTLCILSLLALLATIVAGCADPLRQATKIDTAYADVLKADNDARRAGLIDDDAYRALTPVQKDASVAVSNAYAAAGPPPAPDVAAILEDAAAAVRDYAAAVAAAVKE